MILSYYSKLTATIAADRLEKLKNGKKVTRRDIETFLTTNQIEAWDAA